MDKNTIIGFVLIALVLFGFTWYSQPSADEQRAAFVKDSIENVLRQKAEKESKLAAAQKQKEIKEKSLEDSTALFYKALSGQSRQIVLKNTKVVLPTRTLLRCLMAQTSKSTIRLRRRTPTSIRTICISPSRNRLIPRLCSPPKPAKGKR